MNHRNHCRDAASHPHGYLIPQREEGDRKGGTKVVCHHLTPAVPCFFSKQSNCLYVSSITLHLKTVYHIDPFFGLMQNTIFKPVLTPELPSSLKPRTTISHRAITGCLRQQAQFSSTHIEYRSLIYVQVPLWLFTPSPGRDCSDRASTG